VHLKESYNEDAWILASPKPLQRSKQSCGVWTLVVVVDGVVVTAERQVTREKEVRSSVACKVSAGGTWIGTRGRGVPRSLLLDSHLEHRAALAWIRGTLQNHYIYSHHGLHCSTSMCIVRWLDRSSVTVSAKAILAV